MANMVTFKTRKRDGRVFPIQGATPKSNVEPTIVKEKKLTQRELLKIGAMQEMIRKERLEFELRKKSANPNGNNKEIKISLREIKKLRDKAVAEGKDRFFINGKPVLVSFAKFMIEFLEKEIKRRGLKDTDKITLQPTERSANISRVKKNNPNNDISKDDFQKFVRVRDSGVTNMFDVNAVSRFSGLEKQKIFKIMKNFNDLSRKFPNVVKGSSHGSSHLKKNNPNSKNPNGFKRTRSLLITLVGLSIALSLLRRFRFASGSNQTFKGSKGFKVTKLKGGFVRTETKLIGKRKPQRFRFIQPNPKTKIRLGFVEAGKKGPTEDVVTEVAVFRR